MKKKYLTVIGIILGFVIIGVVFLQIVGNKKNGNPNFKTVQASRDTIIKKVTESGKVEPVISVDVKSELAGEVIKLFVDEGDKVEAGEKLALIKPQPDEAQQIAQSKASILSRKLDLEDAERNLRRKEVLYEKGFIAKQEVEDAQKLYENSKIQLQMAKRQLRTILGSDIEIDVENIDLERVDNVYLRSPLNGIVTIVGVEEGEIITSGTHALGGGGTPIMTVAELDEMVVEANINEVDVGKLEVGQKVEIGFDAIRGKIYNGKVKKISPSSNVEENIVVYPVEVEILDSDGRIRPGMTADLNIITGEAKDIICIPKEALIESDGRTMVLTRKEGKVVPKPIVMGLEGDIKVEIKNGLLEGDTVLIPEQIGEGFTGFGEGGERRGPPPPGR
jgi:HlyD family secretion protein